MDSSIFHFLPMTPWFFFALMLLVGVLIAMLQIGILGYAYEKIGISRNAAYALLLASLLGSMVNIPVAQLPGGQAVVMKEVNDGWWHYQIPVVEQWPNTTLAVNLGGAIIPALFSIYLVAKNQIYGEALAGVAAVAAVVHALATPVPQMGIAVPIFIPPIVSAVVAVFLSREYAAPLAYVAGCMGTLVGADLLNLGKLSQVGASIQSIGGAGTIDGVFLTGILAVLLAARPGANRRTPDELTTPQR